MRIAILQSDSALSKDLQDDLVPGGHTCMAFTDGLQISKLLARSSVDLLVLDWIADRLCGKDLMRTVHAVGGTGLPVIFASRDASHDSVLRAYELGADDYVTLPTPRKLFRARVEAVLRRAYKGMLADSQLNVGPYCFDRLRLKVSRGGRSITLSDTQYRLAHFLFSNVGRVLSREHIFAAVWGRELREVTRTIDSHVSRLRVLLDIEPDNGFQIQPVYKSGYRLVDLRGAEAAGNSR